MYLTTLLVGLTVMATRFPPIRVKGCHVQLWLIMLAFASAAGVAAKIVHPLGACWLGLIGVLFVLSNVQALSQPSRRAGLVLAVALTIVLGSGQLPGFTDVVWAVEQVSPNAPTFRLTTHFDVGVAGAILLARYGASTSRFRWAGFREAAAGTAAASAAAAAVVLGSAWALGVVEPDPKLPPHAALHLAKTLLWTAVYEETVFRAVIQEQLSRLRVFSSGRMRWAPVVLVAALFGVAHLRSGLPFALVASIAGLAYGTAYLLTKRIDAAIAAHFSVNSAHYLLFTYPFLLRSVAT
jgi:membrane protease YdiL (CAAX protease family)